MQNIRQKLIEEYQIWALNVNILKTKHLNIVTDIQNMKLADNNEIKDSMAFKYLGRAAVRRQFLNLARRFAAKSVRLALSFTFYCGLGNIVRVCLPPLDAAAVMHEILYLRTSW
jgi:hypothetical protein